MITWTIESLEYTNENPEYPKLVEYIHLKAKHSDGPIHYVTWKISPPTDPDYEYVPFEQITRDWVVQLWNLVDPGNGRTTEAYLNDLAACPVRGQGIPWE